MDEDVKQEANSGPGSPAVWRVKILRHNGAKHWIYTECLPYEPDPAEVCRVFGEPEPLYARSKVSEWWRQPPTKTEWVVGLLLFFLIFTPVYLLYLAWHSQ